MLSPRRARRFIPAVALFTILVGAPRLAQSAGAVSLDPPRATPAIAHVAGKIVLHPTDDATVRAAKPKRNYGAKKTLAAKRDPKNLTYLKFTVPAGTEVERAVLKLKIRSDVATRVVLRKAAKRWSESSITFTNRPDLKRKLRAKNVAPGETKWLKINVSDVVDGPGTYSFAVKGKKAKRATFASSEAPNPPRLVISQPDAPPPPPTTTTTTTTTQPPAPVKVLAAGDVEKCGQGSVDTANIIGQHPDAMVLAAGDLAYEEGTLAQFEACFDDNWGRYFDRLYPVPGNHEYLTTDAAGYFAYFGARAGDPDKGYYAFNRGSWRIYALNTNCSKVDGCGNGSPQGDWLASDLAANRGRCTLAFFHHPPWTAGPHGHSSSGQAIWRVFVDGGGDVGIAGHDHNYQRWEKLDRDGQPAADGARYFVSGAGGANHTSPTSNPAAMNVSNADTFGLLRLDLAPSSFTWQFLAEPGASFTDSGSGTCANP